MGNSLSDHSIKEDKYSHCATNLKLIVNQYMRIKQHTFKERAGQRRN